MGRRPAAGLSGHGVPDLHDRILAAHRAGDRAALAALYAEAAEAQTGEDARAFFLTQAWVLALEAGSPAAEALRRTLVAMGRQDRDRRPPDARA